MMLKVDKLLYVTYGLCVALGIFLGLAIAAYSDPEPRGFPFGNPSAEKLDYETRRRASTTDEALSWIDANKRASQQGIEQESNVSSQIAERYYNALSLEAQWASAAAAERMNRLTIWQIVSSALGIGAVLWSLHYTRKAVEASVRAAAAAERSVDLAQDTAKQELRAYISMNPTLLFNILDIRKRISIEFETKNHGQTPGFELKHEYSIGVFPEPLGNTQLPVPSTPVNYLTAVFPGSSMKTWFVYDRNIMPDELAEIEKGTKRLHVWGITSYVDAFGVRRHTKFFASAGSDFVSNARAVKNGEVPLPECNWRYEHRHLQAT